MVWCLLRITTHRQFTRNCNSGRLRNRAENCLQPSEANNPMPDRPRRSRRKTTLPADAPEVASPCISICEMDQKTGLCSGCFRTLEEIATWSRIPNQQRWDIVQSLRDRRLLFQRKTALPENARQ